LLKAAPQTSEELRLRLPALTLEAGQEAFLNLQFISTQNTGWCKAGHIVGWDQIPVPLKSRKAGKASKPAKALEPLEIGQEGGTLKIHNNLVQMGVSTASGLIESFQWKSSDLFAAGPQLQIWRGPVDNDGIKGWGDPNKPLGKWQKQGLDHLTLKTTSSRAKPMADGAVTLIVDQWGSCAASDHAIRHQQTSTVYPDGRILVENVFTVDKAIPDLPRLGVVLVLKPGFEKLKWFGRGPRENYGDRKRSTLVDLHESTVTDQYIPYILPQEHGNHTDVRWLSLENGKGGVRIIARGPMEFTASHYTAHDLYVAKHTYDLKPRPEVILSLDYRQRGLGTGSCGPDTLDPYKIGPGRYRFSYIIQPF
jgi:beta-galactosidase